MIIEDQLDRGAGRIGGVETLEEFNELPAAVAVSDARTGLAGKQVNVRPTGSACHGVCTRNPARRSRATPGLGGKSRCCRCEWPPCRLVAAGNDRRSLDGFARLGGGSLQNLDLAAGAQSLRPSSARTRHARRSSAGAQLVRLDFRLAADLARRAWNQPGESFVPRTSGRCWRAMTVPNAASSGAHAARRCSVALSRAGGTSQASASGAMTGSLPGRGRSSTAARRPSPSARSTQR